MRKLTATDQGIFLNGMKLTERALEELPEEAARYVCRARELLKTVKPEDRDNREPHDSRNMPALATIHTLLSLAVPRSLSKAGYNANEPRDAHGKWTNGDGVTAADRKNPRFKGMGDTQIKKQKFVDAHLAAAENGAKQLNVPVENILGLSALESGWGRDKFPMVGNNYFGQHSPAPLEIDSFPVDKDSSVRGSKFNDYSDSLQSFIQTRDHIIQGVSDPEQFAQALQDSGAYGIIKSGTAKHPVYYPDPTYVPKVKATIKGLSDYIVRAKQSQ